MKFEEEESAMCERLNCKNYRVWALQMKMILIKEDLWDIIVPGSSNPEDAVKSLKVLAHIVLMLDNDQLVHVSEAKGGKEAWDSLKNFHHNDSAGHKMRLYKQLFKTELSLGGDMQKHLQKLFEILQNIKECGDHLEETMIVSAILSNLHAEYDNSVTGLESWKEKDLTVQNVKLKLIDEWERRYENVRKGSDVFCINRTEIDPKKHIK